MTLVKSLAVLTDYPGAMRPVRLILCLLFTLSALLSEPARAAMMRAAPSGGAGVMMATLCIDGVSRTVALDAEGQPLPDAGAAHDDPAGACADCPLCMLAPAGALPVPATARPQAAPAFALSAPIRPFAVALSHPPAAAAPRGPPTASPR